MEVKARIIDIKDLKPHSGNILLLPGKKVLLDPTPTEYEIVELFTKQHFETIKALNAVTTD
jgi:hypothetical protein